MTLLQQCMEWATGSTLSPKYRNTRIILTIVSASALAVILFVSIVSTYTLAENRISTPRARPVYEDSMPSQFRQNLLEQEQLRRLDILNNLLVSLIINNSILFGVLNGILWLTWYGVLKPLSDEHNERESFIAHASHELRTPLAIIKSKLQLLDGEKNLTQLHKTRLETIAQVDRLNELSTRLLSPLDTQDTTAKVSVLTTIHSIVEELNSINHNTVSFQIPKKPDFKLTINSAKLHQLLYNLLDNVYRYSSLNSTATITLNSDKKTIVIINPSTIKKIIPGIGLQICHKLALQLGAQLTQSLSKNLVTTRIQF
jgi:signal transduction histidine kinase